MNFLNPYIEIYLRKPGANQHELISFYREVLWLFSKNLNNRLRMYQHRVNILIEDGYEIPRNFRFGSIYEYRTTIDIETFRHLDNISQRKEILEIVYKGFVSLAKEYNWDLDAINEAYKHSIEENFEFIYYTDFKLSSNKKYKGRIRINLEERLATFTSELISLENEELLSTVLLKTDEGNFSWWKYLREFGWMDQDNFGLKIMKGEIWITANTTTNKVIETFQPKKSTINLLVGFLEELKEPII